MKLLTLLLLLAQSTMWPPAEKPKKLPRAVTLRVIDVVGLAPLTVRVKVRVPRDERNRELIVKMEGPYEGESFTRELDGTSAITYDRNFEVRGGGPITFIATVRRNDGSRPFAQATYCYKGVLDGTECLPIDDP